MNTEIVFIAFLFGIIAWSFSFLFRERAKQKKLKFQAQVNVWFNYLESDAMAKGDFNKFKEVPIEFIKNQTSLIITNLRYLMHNNPEKIINLINLDLDQNKKAYLEEVLSNELSISIRNTVDSAFKVWGYDKENNTDIKIISYIASLLESDIRTIFASELRSKVRATGGYLHISLTKKSEEIVGVRV